MSRYDELCGVYTESRMKFARYQSECQHFLEQFAQGLVEAFCVPPEKFKLFPAIGERDPAVTYTVQESMKLAQDNFWHIGIEIILVCQSCPTDPIQPVMINLGVKKENNVYLLKTSPEDEPFGIAEKSPEQLKYFYDELFTRIQGLLEKSVDVLMEKEPTACKIGFVSECD